MNGNRKTVQNSRLRSFRITAIVSLVFFASLLGWQVFVLTTGAYPEHILPVVKILSGTQESIAVAYDWTIRLGAITIVGLAASLIGSIAVTLRIRKESAHSRQAKPSPPSVI